MFCKIPTAPTPSRNQVLLLMPAAVMSNRIHSRARSTTATRVRFEVDTSTLAGPAERSSRSSPTPTPRTAIACWAPLPRVSTTVFSDSRRQAHFSLRHWLSEPDAKASAMPTKRLYAAFPIVDSDTVSVFSANNGILLAIIGNFWKTNLRRHER